MNALSIQQPWAWCIIRPDVTDPASRAALDPERDIKPIENRTWYTRIRGPLLIHAGKIVDYEAFGIIHEEFGLRLPDANKLKLGGFIGIVNLVDCVDESDSPWFNGPYGFVFTDPRPIEFTPWRGQLGIFDVPHIELTGDRLKNIRQGTLL